MNMFDIRMSVHSYIIPHYSQQDATFLEFISTDAVHVSGRSSAHNQEHMTVHTASGNMTVHTASGIVNQHCRSGTEFHLIHGSS